MKFLKLIPLFLIVIACSKKNDDVTPALKESDLIGTWYLENVDGNITINGKKETYKNAEFENSAISYYEYNFNTNGKGTQDGEPITYKLAGNKLTIIDEYEISLILTVKIENDKLILVGDKTSFQPLILLEQASTGDKITDWNETVTYSKTPPLSESNLIGTWNLESVKGSITIDGKKEDYTDANSSNVIIAYKQYVFKANGVGESDGYAFKYKLNGNKLTIDDDEIAITINAKIENKKLILSGDKTNFAPLILLVQAFGVKVTQWDETATYVKK